MPRLLDDIRAAGRLAMPRFIDRRKEDVWAKYAQQVFSIIKHNEMPVLLIDNVAGYYYEQSDQEYWEIGRDIPNIAPPYPQFWCEHKMPKVIHSKEEGDADVTQWSPHGRVGMLFTAIATADVEFEGELPANAKWFLWCDMFIDSGDFVAGPHGATLMCVDSDGGLIDRPWMQSLAAPQWIEMMKSYMAWFNPALLAISFLHCKNVTVVDNAADKPLAKKWASKHGGLRLTPWKTLVIEPLKQILRREGRSHQVGLAKSLHICRGHFRDYREGRGLFGKYHQLVWTPMTVRGSKGGKAPAPEVEIKI